LINEILITVTDGDVTDLVVFVAKVAPGSYGVLHYFDDEALSPYFGELEDQSDAD